MSRPLAGTVIAIVGSETPSGLSELVVALGADPLVLRDERVFARLAEAEILGAVDTDGALAGVEVPFPVVQMRSEPARWVASGLAALSGPAGGSALARGPFVERLSGAGALFQLLAATQGVPVELDVMDRLAERARIARFEGQGPTAVGGSAIMVRAADGWVALNLARPEDIAALPALVERAVDPAGWPRVAAALRTRTVTELRDQAERLGVPIGVVPPGGSIVAGAPFRFEDREASASGSGSIRNRLRPDRAIARRARPPVVVELASLWAGPLTGALLVSAGADVTKYESTERPDGARRGPAPFFDRLHSGKHFATFDHRDPADLNRLAEVLATADVVIDGSRARVMEQWGIDVGRLVRSGTTWISITGHGRASARVAFGDDAAVEAGLVVPGRTANDAPTFVGDAIADPITGLYGAVVALAATLSPGGHLVDLSLVGAAAHAAAGTTFDAVDPT
ncbi:MAG: CoA transferase [Acidimicrobiales bacterium]|nr:CoA transferase [Acidimicrobiales bacterium]